MHMGGGGNLGMGYGMGMFGGPGSQGNGAVGGLNGSPPRQAESTMLLTPHWQHQMMRYEVSSVLSRWS